MTTPRRALPTLSALALVGVLAACAAQAGGPVAAVGDTEARDVVARVVALAAERNPEAMRRLCAENDGCLGMSGGIDAVPEEAPGPDRAPRELCVVAVPATPSQAGSRVVVLEGTDGNGRPYVTQVLVDRVPTAEEDADGLRVQEPGFWRGVRYTALQHGRAWSAASDGPGQPEADNESARRACTDTDAWLAEVAGTGAPTSSAPPATEAPATGAYVQPRLQPLSPGGPDRPGDDTLDWRGQVRESLQRWPGTFVVPEELPADVDLAFTSTWWERPVLDVMSEGSGVVVCVGERPECEAAVRGAPVVLVRSGEADGLPFHVLLKPPADPATTGELTPAQREFWETVPFTGAVPGWAAGEA
ncbi:hypothetical protein [Kineococcus sp. SYSU DK004]|uniref:hypothetical protein n=1 Tax=Kineococcus sp. SYSU DK004 TaxID=3383125 RepID=UPI003D7CF0A8